MKSDRSDMTAMLAKHLSALIGAAVTVAGILSLLTSSSVKNWVRNDSYLIFIILIIVVTVAFVIIDFILNRKRQQATGHDRKIVANLLSALPPDGAVIVWLKESFISKSVPIKYVDVLGDMLTQMRLNVVGLDNPQADEAYRKLKEALANFITVVTFNLFSSQDYTALQKSPEWPWAQWKKASDEINGACTMLVRVYDEFLLVCHKNQLD
jgi:hypothetical protein